PVPDTYRWARFRSRRTGRIAADIAVGKYSSEPRKRIYVRGTQGEAILDRDRGELRVEGQDGLVLTRPSFPGDTGYDVLARALLAGEVPAEVLNPLRAVDALRLIERAHLLALSASLHGEAPRENAFVSDWQLAPPN